MSTVAGPQRLTVTLRLWTVLADPARTGWRSRRAGSPPPWREGSLATSDSLLHPVAYGLQVAVMVVGAVAAALVWLRRRPVSAIAPLLLALAFAKAIVACRARATS